jgi:PAS domain S-box-containing protein
MQAQEGFRRQAGLLDLTQDAILVRDLEDRVAYWNRGAERLYGWTAQEALERKVTSLIFGDTVEFENARRAFLTRGEWTGELRQVTKSGQERIVDSRWKLLRDDAGQPQSVLVTDTDITEKKRLETQFLHAQRLESIGTLASGIAHDLNNVLAPIMLSVQMLRERSVDADGLKLLATVETSAKRGADVVRQVLAFARGVEGERMPLHVRHLIKETVGLLRQTLAPNITLRIKVARGLHLLTGDATQLHQVLLNLAVNARDAMPEGGTLEFSAANVDLDERHARQVPPAPPGPYVVLRVRDTGVGIPPAIRDRIFDPFFTTKGVGKGTGLGLSTVMGIVKSHGGFVDVESQPGKGTTFHVYLPATVVAPPPGNRPLPAAPDLPAGHGELVLVVDDESAIREVTARILERHGYEVVLAGDGGEALARFSLERERLKAVITDLAMPNMDGVALVRELLSRQPGLKIIASSGIPGGGDEGGKADQLRDLAVAAFLPKPYAAETLLTTLRRLLDGRPPISNDDRPGGGPGTFP